MCIESYYFESCPISPQLTDFNELINTFTREKVCTILWALNAVAKHSTYYMDWQMAELVSWTVHWWAEDLQFPRTYARLSADKSAAVCGGRGCRLMWWGGGALPRNESDTVWEDPLFVAANIPVSVGWNTVRSMKWSNDTLCSIRPLHSNYYTSLWNKNVTTIHTYFVVLTCLYVTDILN